MLALLKLLICGIDEEQLSPRKKLRSKLGVCEGIYFGCYGCTSLVPQPKQCFTARRCLRSQGHFALECFLGKKTQTHTVPCGVVSSSMLSGPFCSCLATREGRRRRRRRMWEHGGTWRSRLSVANRLAKSALGSLELLRWNRSSALALFRWLSAEGADGDPALILCEFYPNMNPWALPELFFLNGSKWGKKQDLVSAQSLPVVS